MAKEYVHADLVGHKQFKVGRFGSKVADKLRLCSSIRGYKRNRPRPLIHAAAPVVRNGFAGRNGLTRARLAGHQRALLRVGGHVRGRCVSAEDGGDEFTEVVVGFVVRGEISPQISAGRLVHVGDLLEERVALCDRAFVVVRALVAAITLLPGLFQVVGADGGVGPDMSISGDFAGVEKVVQHSELECELMQVRRDGDAIYGEALVAIANRLAAGREIAEDLIVRAVLLDDVDDVLDGIPASATRTSPGATRIRARGKRNSLGGSLHAVRLQN